MAYEEERHCCGRKHFLIAACRGRASAQADRATSTCGLSGLSIVSSFSIVGFWSENQSVGFRVDSWIKHVNVRSAHEMT